MKSLKEFLEGVELPFMAEAFTDRSTPADFDSQTDITAYLLKDRNVKTHVGKAGLYFDDADLVFGDKTVAKDLIGSHGWDPDVTMAELKKKILAMPSYKATKDAQNVSRAAKPGQDHIGRFDVKLPTQVSGTHGSKAFGLDKPRIIVDVKDAADEAAIKKLHNARKGVMVRVMKRSSGSKVYIDFTKDASEIDQFKKDLAKI